jgi:hypothetical protein
MKSFNASASFGELGMPSRTDSSSYQSSESPINMNQTSFFTRIAERLALCPALQTVSMTSDLKKELKINL